MQNHVESGAFGNPTASATDGPITKDWYTISKLFTSSAVVRTIVLFTLLSKLSYTALFVGTVSFVLVLSIVVDISVFLTTSPSLAFLSNSVFVNFEV